MERLIDKLVVQELPNPPQNLDQARKAVLDTIPGLAYYIPDIEVHMEEIDRNLDTMVEDIIHDLDAGNEIALIVQNMGWSDAQAGEFFTNPARHPYRSSVRFSGNFGERAQQFAIIGQYARHRYTVALKESAAHPLDEEKKRESQKTKENARNFFSASLNNLFAPAVFAFTDKFNGINPSDRRTGKIRPTRSIHSLIRKASYQAALEDGSNPKEVYQGVMAATEQGSFTTIRSFLEGYKGERAVRKALDQIFITRAKNRRLEREKLSIVWASETYRHAMGLDLETYHQVNDHPDSQTQNQRTHEYLQKPSFIRDVWFHLCKEAPAVVADWEAYRLPMNYLTILWERANNLGLPDKTASLAELEAKKQDAWADLRSIFPLGFVDSPLSFVDAPTNKGAEPRATSITYRNRFGETVNVVNLNLRASKKVFRAVTAHELTHKTHKEIIKRAEDNGLMPKGSMEGLPNPVKESLALFVEGQVASMDMTGENGNTSSAKPWGKWRNILHATLMRRQGPYALAQKAVRLEMDRMWDRGQRSRLTTGQANRILRVMQPQVEGWFAEGIPIVFPHQSVTANLNPTRPNDGLIYLSQAELFEDPSLSTTTEKPKSDSESQKIAGSQPITMDLAFSDRFGEGWLLKKDARAVLLALFVESGRNHKVQTYGAFIQNANIEQSRILLSSLGVTEDLI